MKSMYLPSVAIFYDIFLQGRGDGPLSPPSPIRYWTDKTITRTKAELFHRLLSAIFQDTNLSHDRPAHACE